MKFMDFHSRAVIVGLLLFGLVACSSSGADLPPLELSQSQAYTLDSGDTLRVTVFGNQDLSGTYPIDGAGTISFPLIGTVEARGLSRQELETNLQQRLSQNILVDPSVSIQIISFRPYYVLGEVNRPGQFPYVNDITVLAAVAIAGGYTYRAKLDYAKITRKVGDEVVERRAEPSSLLLPGDVVYIYERLF